MDTNILVHAFNRSSPYQVKAADTLRRGLTNEFEAFIAPQIIFEFYAVITDPRRVEKPLAPEEAAGTSMDLLESKELQKIGTSPLAAREILELAKKHSLKGGDIFDCVLAVNARDNEIDMIYTQNVRDFNPYSFLRAVNPLKDE